MQVSCGPAFKHIVLTCDMGIRGYTTSERGVLGLISQVCETTQNSEKFLSICQVRLFAERQDQKSH